MELVVSARKGLSYVGKPLAGLLCIEYEVGQHWTTEERPTLNTKAKDPAMRMGRLSP